MKAKVLRACLLSIAAAAASFVATGCVVYPNGAVRIQPFVIAQAPVMVVSCLS